MKVSETPQKHCIRVNFALLFACLGAVVNSLHIPPYLGLLWFLAREYCFHARWNCKNPSLWLSSHTGGSSCLSSLVTHKLQELLQSLCCCTVPAALSFCSNKLYFQNKFIFYLLILLDSIYSHLISFYFPPSLLFLLQDFLFRFCSTHSFSVKYPLCKKV